MGAFTRQNWNDLLDQVNAKLGTQLEHVPPKHTWTRGDIQTVRDAITDGCANAPPFVTPLVKWTRAILDELTAALDDCECTLTVPLSCLGYWVHFIARQSAASTYTIEEQILQSTSTVNNPFGSSNPSTVFDLKTADLTIVSPADVPGLAQQAFLRQSVSGKTTLYETFATGYPATPPHSPRSALPAVFWFVIPADHQIAAAGFAGRVFELIDSNGIAKRGWRIATNGLLTQATYFIAGQTEFGTVPFSDPVLRQSWMPITATPSSYDLYGWLPDDLSPLGIDIENAVATGQVKTSALSVCVYNGANLSTTGTLDHFVRQIPLTGLDYYFARIGSSLPIPPDLLNLNSPQGSPFCSSQEAAQALIDQYNEKYPTNKVQISQVLMNTPPATGDIGNTPNVILLGQSS